MFGFIEPPTSGWLIVYQRNGFCHASFNSAMSRSTTARPVERICTRPVFVTSPSWAKGCRRILREGEQCSICKDPKRDHTQLCVVEQPRDLMALEQSGVFRGVYHVLLGRIAPLEGIGPAGRELKYWIRWSAKPSVVQA